MLLVQFVLMDLSAFSAFSPNPEEELWICCYSLLSVALGILVSVLALVSDEARTAEALVDANNNNAVVAAFINHDFDETGELM